jgi:hypothetical protein
VLLEPCTHNCEAYEDHRHNLSEVSRHHDAPFLLGTNKGLLATAKFAKNTGAFTATGLPYEPPPTPSMPGLRLLDPPILLLLLQSHVDQSLRYAEHR